MIKCLFQAVKYLERMLVQAQSQKDQQELSAGKEINIDPKTYCKLGHFHLLLEDYTKGTNDVWVKGFLPISMSVFYDCLLAIN